MRTRAITCSTTINIYLECHDCGMELDFEVNEVNNVIRVKPCSICQEEWKDEQISKNVARLL